MRSDYLTTTGQRLTITRDGTDDWTFVVDVDGRTVGLLYKETDATSTGLETWWKRSDNGQRFTTLWRAASAMTGLKIAREIDPDPDDDDDDTDDVDDAPMGSAATVLHDDVTVTATMTRTTADGWDTSRQVPTFKVPCGPHAMRDLTHAAEIAADVLATWAPDGTRIVLALSTPDATHVATYVVTGGRPTLTR